ncbi:hypothetical protein Enr13x_32270 [Stieleria neptunia]|uniref:Uncharacterized protein n=1 Tax=Stieleria neptunia TaxID=2527979 RepID=A0A518HRE9_9BACT|nr:hypothetical protein Enr13x_32270 [Stieleria neptunia]
MGTGPGEKEPEKPLVVDRRVSEGRRVAGLCGLEYQRARGLPATATIPFVSTESVRDSSIPEGFQQLAGGQRSATSGIRIAESPRPRTGSQRIDPPAVPQIALLIEVIVHTRQQAGIQGSNPICFDTLRGRVTPVDGFPEVSLRSPPATGFDPVGVMLAFSLFRRNFSG